MKTIHEHKHHIFKDTEIVHQTQKAYLINVYSEKLQEQISLWIPRSQVTCNNVGKDSKYEIPIFFVIPRLRDIEASSTINHFGPDPKPDPKPY